MKRRQAFTLIELLFVVAIIAVLAAIAVPNFLEAQVRSKVSRVRSDMAVLEAGLFAYFADHNEYAPNRRAIRQFLEAAAEAGPGELIAFKQDPRVPNYYSMETEPPMALIPLTLPPSQPASAPASSASAAERSPDYSSSNYGYGYSPQGPQAFATSRKAPLTEWDVLPPEVVRAGVNVIPPSLKTAVSKETPPPAPTPTPAPASMPGGYYSYNYGQSNAPAQPAGDPAMANTAHFLRWSMEQSGGDLAALTTPVAYLSGYLFKDPFASYRNQLLGYLNLNAVAGHIPVSLRQPIHNRYLLFSNSPATEWQFTNPVYGPFTHYDPTNGTTSRGALLASFE